MNTVSKYIHMKQALHLVTAIKKKLNVKYI